MIELAEMVPLTERCCILRRPREQAAQDFAAGQREGHGWRASADRDGDGTP
jgi:hypothetical protein